MKRRDFLTGAAAVASAGIISAVPLRRPNILLLFPDQHRFDWLGGDSRIPVHTPNLDRLADRGARFERCYVASPLCAPSRACLASGKEYDDCGVGSNIEDYPLGQTTYYTLLRNSGYHVAGCGKLDLSKGSYDWGIDGRHHMSEWGFSDMINNAGKGDAVHHGAQEPYMNFLRTRDLAAIHIGDFEKRTRAGDYPATWPTPLPDDAYCDNWIGRNGLELMKRFPAGKPWHLVVNFAGPHDPEDITARMEKTCRLRNFLPPSGNTQYPPEVHNAIRQKYTAMVENLDRWVGIYVEEVARRGELDNTIIAFSSDHGEMLGDHNRWRKSVPFEPAAHVPLLIAGPGVSKRLRSLALVNHIDLGATFLDYADTPKAEGMVSRSLRPTLGGHAQAHREYVRSGLGGWRMVTDGRYKLVLGFDPLKGTGALARETRQQTKSNPPLLFDLENDPGENRNLANDKKDVVARLSTVVGR